MTVPTRGSSNIPSSTPHLETADTTHYEVHHAQSPLERIVHAGCGGIERLLVLFCHLLQLSRVTVCGYTFKHKHRRNALLECDRLHISVHIRFLETSVSMPTTEISRVHCIRFSKKRKLEAAHHSWITTMGGGSVSPEYAVILL